MSLWECQTCGHLYDSELGDRASGVAPGTPFDKLPRGWACPKCRAPKAEFEEVEDDEDEDGGFEEEGDFDDDDLPDDEEDEDEDDDFPDDLSGDEDESDDGLDDEPEDEEDEDGPEGDDPGLDDEPEDDDDEEAEEDEEVSEEAPEEEEEDGEEDEDEDEADEEGAWGSDKEEEEEEEPDEPLEDDTRFICGNCGWIFDPAVGHLESGVSPGTPFEELVEEWACPSCGAPQSRFRPHEDALNPPFDMPPSGKGIPEGSSPTKEPSVQDPLAAAFPAPLSLGLGDLLFRPAPLFSSNGDERITSLTLVGAGSERPLRLTTPLILAPIPFGGLTSALKMTLARASARVGTACTSGGPTLPEARKIAALYILEVAPGRPAPGPEELAAADAAEILLGRTWNDLEEVLVPGRTLRGMLAPVTTVRDLCELVAALRKSLRGPIGVRLPAGAIEADLAQVMRASPNYVVLEGYGAGTGVVPTHVRHHANMPIWLAIHRARQFLDTRGFAHVSLVAAGDVRCAADMARLLALGASAIMLSTSAVVAMGLWGLRPEAAPASASLLEMAFESEDAVEKLVDFIRRSTAEMMDFCRLAGKSDLQELTREDLLTPNLELARLLGLESLG